MSATRRALVVEPPTGMTRREFVRLAVVAGLAGLAGCAGPSLGSTTTSAVETATPIIRRDPTTKAKSPVTIGDLGLQPFVGEHAYLPAIVYKVKVAGLRASSVKRGYNTAQYAIQHPSETAFAIVAYVGKCTHLGCTVGWHAGLGASKDIEDYDGDGAVDGRVLCPCHQAQFDVYDLGKHAPGTPAPRPLDVLRIRIATWTDEAGTEHENVILALESIAQPLYRSADRQGDGASFNLQPASA